MSIAPSQGDTIDIAEVNRSLSGTRLGGVVQHLPTVGSTNNLALEEARSGVRQGAWVADEQTAGRGRGNHAWHSAPGDGLYVSALWTPHLPASPYALSLAAGLAAWDAIREAAGLTVDLRWPNDLVSRAESPSRKLGGILTETSTQPSAGAQPALLRYAVIGIGINVAHRDFPPALQPLATSLRQLGWHEPSRQALLVALLRTLDHSIHELEASYAKGNGSSALFARLPEASTWIRGKRVHVGDDTGGYTGVTAGLDGDGFLRVQAEDGILHTVRSGGVREA